MSDKSNNSMRYHIFGMVDKDNCEVLGSDIGTGMFLLQVMRYLDCLAEWHCHLLSNLNRIMKLAKD